MAQFETQKSGRKGKATTLARREIRAGKYMPETTTLTRSGHVKRTEVSK